MLELEALRRRLDDELAGGERIQIGHRAQALGRRPRLHGVQAPAGGFRWRPSRARARPRSSASGTGSCNSVTAPERAPSWAIPEPIVPAPSTPMMRAAPGPSPAAGAGTTPSLTPARAR